MPQSFNFSNFAIQYESEHGSFQRYVNIEISEQKSYHQKFSKQNRYTKLNLQP